MPQEPTREYHTFSGWYTGPNGSGSQFTSNTTVNSNLTLYAYWISTLSSGSLDPTFNPGGAGANSFIFSMGTQSDGKILIVGEFIGYNDTSRNRVARLNSDGSLDTTFDPGTAANGGVYAAQTQSDGKILIGGTFTSYNGTSINRIARLNPDGSLDTTFNQNGSGANFAIRAIQIQSDGKILVGGDFSSYNDMPINRIARLNPDGSLDTTFNQNEPGFGGSYVSSIQTQSDGKILVSGWFSSYNGTSVGQIARLNPDGSLDTTFNQNGSGASNAVIAMQKQSDDKIIIGGIFTAYNGTSTGRIVRLNQDGSLDIGFGTNVISGGQSSVLSIQIQSDGKILVGGDFFLSHNGTPINRIARIIQ